MLEQTVMRLAKSVWAMDTTVGRVSLAIGVVTLLVTVVLGLANRRYQTASPALRLGAYRGQDHIDVIAEPKTDRPCGLRYVEVELPNGDFLNLSEHLELREPEILTQQTQYRLDLDEVKKAVRIKTEYRGIVKVKVVATDTLGRTSKTSVRVKVPVLRPGYIRSHAESSLYLFSASQWQRYPLTSATTRLHRIHAGYPRTVVSMSKWRC